MNTHHIDDKPSRFESSRSHGLSRQESTQFWIVFGVSQVLGVAIVGLVAYWCRLYGEFSWTGDPNLQFYFHPVLMVLGLVFFYGDAIIAYRVLRFLPKPLLKLVHAGLHLCAIICSSVGLAAVLQYHARTNKPDFYSLHSWIGIATFALFCFQYVGGFVVFLWPGVRAEWRARAMPFHTFFGCGLLVAAIAAVQTGFTEKLIWTEGYTQAAFNTRGVLGNALAMAIIVFGFLIMFITTHAPYKRQPLPGELPHANVR
jgi:cytochrome b-561